MNEQKKGSTAGLIIVVLIILGLLGSCMGGGETEEHKCMKCNGKGKVRDEYGYHEYVTCPRCHGVGSLEY